MHGEPSLTEAELEGLAKHPAPSQRHGSREIPALPQSVWAHQFGERGRFGMEKLTDLYWNPSMSSFRSFRVRQSKRLAHELQNVRSSQETPRYRCPLPHANLPECPECTSLVGLSQAPRQGYVLVHRGTSLRKKKRPPPEGPPRTS